LGRSCKLHAFAGQFFVSLLDVVGFPGGVHEGSDPVFLPFGPKQNDAGFGAWNGKLNPTLLFVELLVREDSKA